MLAERLDIHRLQPHEVSRIEDINKLISLYFHEDDHENLQWAQEAFLGMYQPLEYQVYTVDTLDGQIASFLTCGFIPLNEENKTYAVGIEWRLTQPQYQSLGLSEKLYSHMKQEIQKRTASGDMQVEFIFGETVNTQQIEIKSNRQGRKRVYCTSAENPEEYFELPYMEPTDQINQSTGLPKDKFSNIPRHLMIESNITRQIDTDDILSLIFANYIYIHIFPTDFFETEDAFVANARDKTELYKQTELFLRQYPNILLLSYEERTQLEQQGNTFHHHQVE